MSILKYFPPQYLIISLAQALEVEFLGQGRQENTKTPQLLTTVTHGLLQEQKEPRPADEGDLTPLRAC